MDFKPLIDYSQSKPTRSSFKLCPVSVGIIIIAVALVAAFLHGLDMRGVDLW